MPIGLPSASVPPQGIKPKKWYAIALAAVGVALVPVLILTLFDFLIMPLYVGLNKSVKVPDTRNMSAETAKRALEALGFSPMITGDNPAFDSRMVVSQTPPPNSDAKSGRRVYLTLNKAKEVLTMPNIMGRSIREATIILTRLGLELGDIAYIQHDSLAPGIIISQSVAPNARITSDQKSSVTASLGKEVRQIVVPDLSGLSLEEAMRLIQEKELVMGIISYDKNGTFLPNTVISQLPAAGESVEAGSNVNITLAQ